MVSEEPDGGDRGQVVGAVRSDGFARAHVDGGSIVYYADGRFVAYCV